MLHPSGNTGNMIRRPTFFGLQESTNTFIYVWAAYEMVLKTEMICKGHRCRVSTLTLNNLSTHNFGPSFQQNGC